MNTQRLLAIDMISKLPDGAIADVIDYLSKMQAVAASGPSMPLDFSKYTRKGTMPLGMDAQKWVEELRSGDRI